MVCRWVFNPAFINIVLVHTRLEAMFTFETTCEHDFHYSPSMNKRQMPHSSSSRVQGKEGKPDAGASIVDLCLLVRQQRIDQVRMALEEDPSLLTQHRWVSEHNVSTLTHPHSLTREPNVPLKQSGVHPLHRAVASGDLEMVTLLLEFGANANERAAWVR